ncbi:zinc-dependent alcohol dehydrogenase [Micromonospora sagamiensis]|uniref:2-deoxy-scyllo-inosamine dehydrogenase n=3 Tax=Micromonospora TaxID=1873 RepID=C9W388_9ACTN|nr:alcohol dehydrogenase catalytic domain-containing protein [Micromonospora sagamiensis]ACN38356.1 2-deoxy-scyllo-inosamine dehydrogenase [Micromonospora inyonensis]TWJ26575.1 (R,R)-butanediol dehydrogenase/meso-butanediol dehydrogenase/diacetyl reductase/2-deoxy-scyllo-inosamine dehydrogenase [Micromonospora sagamiensis]BCL14540.1 2,3-butanediol dehydrogenase [Micromonospora sagamiensis]
MRALQFHGGHKAQIIDTPRPEAPPGWGVVKVHYCCLCGSDLWLYRGKWHGNRYPIVPGHEWAGVVDSAPKGYESWVGRPVTGDLIVGCQTCGPCRDGLPVMCENLIEIGFTVDGGCASYVAVPMTNLYPLPEGMDLAAASQTEPLAVALHAVDRINLRPAERVAVLGAGGIGQLILQSAKATGATVTLATDLVAERRKIAEESGAAAAVHPSELPELTSYADKVDVVFEASGDPESVVRALDLVRPGGRVCLVGYQVGAEHALETARLPLSYASLVGVMGPGGKYREAVDLLANGAIDTRPILTDIVTLDDYGPAIDRAINRTDGTVRVVFDLRGE